MSYVDAIYNSESDKICLSERVDGKRILVEYKPKYEFYYEDPAGKFRNIYGNAVSQIRARNKGEFRKEVAIHKGKNLFESDINVTNKCLEENYKDKDCAFHFYLLSIRIITSSFAGSVSFSSTSRLAIIHATKPYNPKANGNINKPSKS